MNYVSLFFDFAAKLSQASLSKQEIVSRDEMSVSPREQIRLSCKEYWMNEDWHSVSIHVLFCRSYFASRRHLLRSCILSTHFRLDFIG
jgi:hypothetical protein